MAAALCASQRRRPAAWRTFPNFNSRICNLDLVQGGNVSLSAGSNRVRRSLAVMERVWLFHSCRPGALIIESDNRIPAVSFGSVNDNGELEHIASEAVFFGIRAIAVGIPGAFTPVCMHEHLPDFIAKAPLIRKSGFDQAFCITTSEPYSLLAWSKLIDTTQQLRFLSDGNLTFTRACGLAVREEAMYLGELSSRYEMTIENAAITRLRMEPSLLSVTCTRAADDIEIE